MDADSLDKLARTDFGRAPSDVAMEKIAQLIDGAEDAASEAHLDDALAAITTMASRSLTDQQRALLYYFKGNAWSVKGLLRQQGDPGRAWDWEAETLERKITAYRQALGALGFSLLPPYRRAQVLTNLANAMSNVGRFVEAIEYWRRALDIDPRFGMALASMGDCLAYYLHCLYDEGHRATFARRAHELLNAASRLRLEPPTPSRIPHTLEWLEGGAPQGFFDEPLVFRQYNLGRTKGERAYREWCLQHRLFINPLNDLVQDSVAARDVMSLPPLGGTVDEMGRTRGLVGFFNAMKQEYVSARAALFDSLHGTRSRYVDREMFLQDPLDGRHYGSGVEATKTAFRLAYSTLDKVATFLREYLSLPIPPHRTHFRTIWYTNGGQGSKRQLRQEFTGMRNWPLRGLFWLSKDLDIRGEPDLQESLEPDAKGIADLRNNIEHGYVAVMDGGPKNSGIPGLPDDSLATLVDRQQLEHHAMRMLRKSRAALMYLSMAVHIQEGATQSAEHGLCLSISPDPIRHAREVKR